MTTVASLPAKWREKAEFRDGNVPPSQRLRECADELEAALASPAGEGGLPELLDENAAVIRGLESIANDPERGLWSQSLSRGALRIIRRLATPEQPGNAVQGEDWIPVSERLPADGELVMVYTPDSGDGERFDFDFVDDGAWVEHSNQREHFLMVGGPAAAGPDVVCTGPSEEAPYTHWKPVRAPGATPPPAPAAEQGTRSSEDVCDDCNGPNSPPWFAPSDLWNRVVGNEGGMLCPRCFIRRAQSAGVDGVWRVAPDATQPEARGVEGMILVPSHYAENVGYAAAVLEQSECLIDRRNAPALRALAAALAGKDASHDR